VSERRDIADEGGDPACWLDSVCPECGAFVDDSERDHHVCRHTEPTVSHPPTGSRSDG